MSEITINESVLVHIRIDHVEREYAYLDISIRSKESDLVEQSKCVPCKIGGAISIDGLSHEFYLYDDTPTHTDGGES